MRLSLLILCFSTTMLAASGAYPATYEGGSLPLSHRKVRASFNNGALVFVQHGQSLAVPVQNITALSCGSDVHRHMKLAKTEKDYIGMTWTSDNREAEALFKLSGREYRDFLKALETSTGKKAVDAHKVPVVVHYDLSPTAI